MCVRVGVSVRVGDQQNEPNVKTAGVTFLLVVMAAVLQEVEVTIFIQLSFWFSPWKTLNTDILSTIAQKTCTN